MKTLLSMQRTTTGAVKTTPGSVFAISLQGGSAASTVTLSNGSGGTTKWVLACVATGSSNIAFPFGLQFKTSIYATLTGSGARVCVQYE